MASVKTVKSYGKKDINNTNAIKKSVNVFNDLFAKNLSKRLIDRTDKKKMKLEIKELPPRNETCLLENSLQVSIDDTFDKLQKGGIQNQVKIEENFTKLSSSESEASQCKVPSIRISVYSPVMTRRRKRKIAAIITEETVDNIPSKLEKNTTLDKPINFSMSVEKINKNKAGISLGYIKIPNNNENKILNVSPVQDISSRMEASYEPIFSETFRERQAQALVHSSTPIMPSSSSNKLLLGPISPIQLKLNTSKYLEESYNEINKWDSTFPTTHTNKTSENNQSCSYQLKSDNSHSRKKSRSRNLNFNDWKLGISPKVYLHHFDKCGDFKGFHVEQIFNSKQSDKIISDLKISLDIISSSLNECSKISNNNTANKLLVDVNKSESLNGSNSNFNEIEENSLSNCNEIEESNQFNFITARKPRISLNSSLEDFNNFVEQNYEQINNCDNNCIYQSNLKRVNNYCSSIQLDSIDELVEEEEEEKDFVDDSESNNKTEETNNKMQVFNKNTVRWLNKLDLNLINNKNDINDDECEEVIVIQSPGPDDSNNDSNNSNDHNYSINSNLGQLKENISHEHSYANISLCSNKEKEVTEENSEIYIIEDSLSDIETSEVNEDVFNSSPKTNNIDKFVVPVSSKKSIKPKPISLKPGKSYRRSLSILRRSTMVLNVMTDDNCKKFNCDCICPSDLITTNLSCNRTRNSSVRIVPSTPIVTNERKFSYVSTEQDNIIIDAQLDYSLKSLSLNTKRNTLLQFPVTAQDIVLRRCGQTEPLPFEECYTRSALQNCQKIGEGVYGEVFLYRNQNGNTSVMKIIPIEGNQIVNGEKQKKFDEILSEVVIAMELSNLRNNGKNSTSGFSEVHKVQCVKGNYPDRLIDLWDLYNEVRGSENDSPEMFTSNQLYIVLELANGGRDLESYTFNNAAQAFSMFKQTACALAVAESQLQFEHRDLHWGNVLINTVDRNKKLQFRLNGQEINMITHGVEISIIDFTLSRIEFEDVVIFNDLSLDNDLFNAKGDYQFEIYKLMQKRNGNQWRHFEPYSNILWLHYIADKAITALNYKKTQTKMHKDYTAKIKQIKNEILSYNTVTDFVTDKYF